jgi:hypothetical protein
MAKNIPITTRVSKGLFGQKATEPILNVGKAGAYGNNVTKGYPSPTKMMNSPFKQQVHKSKGTGDLEQGQANVTFGSKEPDTVIPGKTTTTYTPPTFTPEGNAAYAKKSKAEQEKQDAAYKKRNSKTTKTPDKIVKGKDTEQTEGLDVFNTGSAKTSYWRRQDDRSVTHTSRKKKAADIKLAKLAAKRGYTTSVDKDGNKVKTAITNKSEFIKNAKLDAKEEMWETRQAGYKGSRDAAVNQSQQSTAVGDEVKGVNVDPNDQQVLQISQAKASNQPDYELQGKMKAGKNKVNDESNKNPATGKQAGALANSTSNEVQQVENTEGSSASTTNNKENVETPAGKKANGFFAKKSPLKMKYFK